MRRLILTFFLVSVPAKKHTLLPDCPLNGNERFPDEFVFGAATSAYQIEGEWNENGKGPSIWDIATHNRPYLIKDSSSGDIACDSYHRHTEDVKALKETGFKAYRFSISWSRIMPSGEPSTLNQAGLDYYHRLIGNLTLNGIKPVATMFHWDLPQPLQDLGGFLNPLIADYFEDYANILFKEFGDKVQNWITFNQPSTICEYGYGQPYVAPFINASVNGGEYLCAYNLLHAHAKAYHLYNARYRHKFHGHIGISLKLSFYYPGDEDWTNADRAMQYKFGLYAHPIFAPKGGWPSLVETEVNANSVTEGRTKSRLPQMAPEIRRFIVRSIDFIGLNYYTSELVRPDDIYKQKTGMEKDMKLLTYNDPEWECSTNNLHVCLVPEGLRDALNWIKEQYGDPEIWITENGWSEERPITDKSRIKYHREHLKAMQQALKCDGVNLTHYFVWSLMDNFEWTSGYTVKYGLYYVAFDDPDRPRARKDSAKFFTDVINSKKIPEKEE